MPSIGWKRRDAVAFGSERGRRGTAESRLIRGERRRAATIRARRSRHERGAAHTVPI